MKSLQECKDEVARKMGFKDFLDYCSNGITGHIVQVMEEAAQLYAREACKEQREICAKVATVKWKFDDHGDLSGGELNEDAIKNALEPEMK